MKTYVCDACGVVIDDPYSVKMREFFVAFGSDMCPEPFKEKVKIHLCNDCFKGLKNVARKKRGEQK